MYVAPCCSTAHLQPADTLLSKINKGDGGKGSALTKLARVAGQTGFVGIWAGLTTRILMTAILVSGQFLVYDQCKQLLGACWWDVSLLGRCPRWPQSRRRGKDSMRSLFFSF